MTESIYAIMFLYEAGELSEGQATKLMNNGSRLEFREARIKIAAEMKAKIQKDFESHGWKWQETIPKCAHTSAAMPERMSAASLHRGGHAGRMLAEPEKHSATREASAHSQPTHQTT